MEGVNQDGIYGEVNEVLNSKVERSRYENKGKIRWPEVRNAK